MADLSADERCSRPVLRFLEMTGVGKTVPKERPAEEDSVVDYASEPEDTEAQWRPTLGYKECGICAFNVNAALH